MTDNTVALTEYLLAAMRCAHLRLRLLQTELDEIAVALKSGLITPEAAHQCLDEIGAMPFVAPTKDAAA